jgi:hypothetical protein
MTILCYGLHKKIVNNMSLKKNQVHLQFLLLLKNNEYSAFKVLLNIFQSLD